MTGDARASLPPHIHLLLVAAKETTATPPPTNPQPADRPGQRQRCAHTHTHPEGTSRQKGPAWGRRPLDQNLPPAQLPAKPDTRTQTPLPGPAPGPTVSPPDLQLKDRGHQCPLSLPAPLSATGDALGMTQNPRKSLWETSGQEKARKCDSKENAVGLLLGQPVETAMLKSEV